MGFRLILYLLVLFMGAFLGYKELLSRNICQRVSKIQMVSLLFLLFFMGVKIGADDRVIGSFMEIGTKALIITVSSILFSILFVKGFRITARKIKSMKKPQGLNNKKESLQ